MLAGPGVGDTPRGRERSSEKTLSFALGGSVSGYVSMEQEAGAASKEEDLWRTPSTGKQFRSAFAQELELEEGAVVRGGETSVRREQEEQEEEQEEECRHGEVQCALCHSVGQEQVDAVRKENTRLKAQIQRVQGDDEKHAKLQAEIDQLTWKLRKMEESRRVYEDATSQLGSFLELVSSQLTVSGR